MQATFTYSRDTRLIKEQFYLLINSESKITALKISTLVCIIYPQKKKQDMYFKAGDDVSYLIKKGKIVLSYLVTQR